MYYICLFFICFVANCTSNPISVSHMVTKTTSDDQYLGVHGTLTEWLYAFDLLLQTKETLTLDDEKRQAVTLIKMQLRRIFLIVPKIVSILKYP